MDVVFGHVDSRLLVALGQRAYLGQRFGVRFVGHLALDVGFVEGGLLQRFLCGGIAADGPYLDMVAEFQRVGLLADAADKRRALPLGLQIVAAQHYVAGIGAVARRDELRVAEHVGGVVRTDLIVHAGQFQVEVVFFLVFVFVVRVFVFVFIFFIVNDGGSASVGRFFRDGGGL